MKYILSDPFFKLEIEISNKKIITNLLYFDEKVRGRMTVDLYEKDIPYSIVISSESFSALYMNRSHFNIVVNGYDISRDKQMMVLQYSTEYKQYIDWLTKILSKHNKYIIKKVKIV